VKILFTDKHDSGIFSWDLFYDYGKNQEKMWQEYLHKLKQAGYERKNNLN
jgi:DUF971 family protein